MMEGVRLVREGNSVHIIVNGQHAITVPWQAAAAVGVELISLSKQIENDQNPEKLIADQALLTRAGVPLGLTNNKAVLAESFKEAQWNSELRRHMPNGPGVPSGEVLGTPIIRRGK